MIFKLHKIPDKIIFRAIFALLILWNLKYFFLVGQVPFTMLFVPYLEQNSFYSQVSDIRDETHSVKDFQDEGKIGFVSDTSEARVFDMVDSVRDFYITQYAIVPSVLKNDTEHRYIIGVYSKEIPETKGLKLVKKINNRTYLYEKS